MQNTLRQDVNRGYCAIYTHREDIRDVVHYIKQKRGKVFVDSKTYKSVGNRRQQAGFFILLKGGFVKFVPLIQQSNIPLHIWKSKGGVAIG